MELIKILVPIAIPVPLSFYFDIFDGLIQAYVFVYLTALFMKEQMQLYPMMIPRNYLIVSRLMMKRM